MKIILANSEQFDKIWNKQFPASRKSASIPTPNIVIDHLDTMIVLRDSVEIGSISQFREDVTLQWLNQTILGKTYFHD